MADKIYEYNGKLYCEEDLSLEDDRYGGDLYWLYLQMKEDGLVSEHTIYYADCHPEYYYESVEDMLDDVFTDMVVGEYSEAENE